MDKMKSDWIKCVREIFSHTWMFEKRDPNKITVSRRNITFRSTHCDSRKRLRIYLEIVKNVFCQRCLIGTTVQNAEKFTRPSVSSIDGKARSHWTINVMPGIS